MALIIKRLSNIHFETRWKGWGGGGQGDLGQLKPLQLGVAGGTVEHTEWHNVTKAL